MDLHPKELHPIKLNPGKFGPDFLAVLVYKIRQTFERTRQWGVTVIAGNKILQTHQSPFPAMNIPRRNESVATDTIHALQQRRRF